MKKLSIALLTPILFISSALANPPIVFSDIDQSNPAFPAVISLAQDGIIGGIDGEIRLNDSISKLHSTLFLLKLVGKIPDIALAQEQNIISDIPTDTQTLTAGEWFVMLNRTYHVVLVNNPDQPWYQSSIDKAVSIGAIDQSVDPTSIVTRQMAITSGYFYREYYSIQEEEQNITNVEQELMLIRDLFIAPNPDFAALRQKVWNSMILLDENSSHDRFVNRIQALRYYHTAYFALIEKKQSGDPTIANTYKLHIQYYLDKAVEQLPNSAEFAEDIRQISGIVIQ